MTNTDRANQVMENACCGGCCGSCDFPRLAAALADAGLLTPDLPTVTHRAGMGVAGTDFPMTGGRFASVHLRESDECLWTLFDRHWVTLIHDRGVRADAQGFEWPDTRHMDLTPDAAREIAYTLLAAANHAEEEA